MKEFCPINNSTRVESLRINNSGDYFTSNYENAKNFEMIIYLSINTRSNIDVSGYYYEIIIDVLAQFDSLVVRTILTYLIDA